MGKLSLGHASKIIPSKKWLFTYEYDKVGRNYSPSFKKSDQFFTS